MEVLTEGDKYIITHKKYYLRFKHDFKQNYQRYKIDSLTNLCEYDIFTSVKEKYIRRYKRFLYDLKNKKTILF